MDEFITYQDIYSEIRNTLVSSRNQAYHAVNFAMVQAYWNVGRIIVECEQSGNVRAEYGKSLIKKLSEQLTEEFGAGFDARNLRNMRQFYIRFPNWNAVRSELTWTHYRLLIKIENDDAREWYMNEAIARYSVLNDAKQIFASKYQLTLPTIDELQREMEEERKRIEEK